ncbi:MAG TPA: pitrilysin family protein [Gammaproteobacteria bacterium]|nr:pitrilysin family protein [Gammaproteobacteria bacterium]
MLAQKRRLSPIVATMLVLGGCSRPAEPPEISLDFEQYRLDNGLNVILHVDRSDPIAAVLMTFHVGSAREEADRTGFAHLFEHLFFLDSENLGPGGLDRLMNRVGSAANGSTSSDSTNYFEVVPIDALEKALWAEADKLGFFINTVTGTVLDKEKQVVKNEKRQRVDNAPYGHTGTVAASALYPDGHPYSWPVIGTLAHLDAATLDDVKAFHERWYGPNNATLAIAGDIDIEQTKAWIERYFAEIPARPMPETSEPEAVDLDGSRYLFHEDNFARLPELTLTWPGVSLFHPDAYALDVLSAILSDGKSTPLYQVVVEDDQLAPNVSMSSSNAELAGSIALRVRAHAATDLDDVHASVERAFERFERDGVSATELERVKAGYEAGFYLGLSSVLGKAMQLADYGLFAPETGYINEHLTRILGVSADDVIRVYETYLAERPYVATSFVPRGETALAIEASVRADVVVEPIVPGEGEIDTLSERGEVPRTPSAIDRSVEPLFGAPPSLSAPAIDRFESDNGIGVFVVGDHETPVVGFSLRIKGGQLLEREDAPGSANFVAEMLMEGTANRTPEELQLAIDLLGASLDVSAEPDSVTLSGIVLARNFAQAMDLVAEILREPRWDPESFTLVRDRIATALRARAADPVSLAGDAFRSLVYGDHALGRNPLGTPESVEAMTLDDLRRFHTEALIPNAADLHVVGAVSAAEVADAVAILAAWPAGEASFPDAPAWDDSRAGLYFLDVPGSAQSVVYIGYLALAQTDPEFYPAEIMNFRLGGGGFASDLTQVLREQRGYTYGIRSGFAGSDAPGPFLIQSLVRSNVTLEALELIKELVDEHGERFDAEDLDATTSYLLRSNALAFETLFAKLGILEDISAFGFSDDYVLEREATVREMTIDRVRDLARRYLDTSRMIWLVVGDGQTQRDRLSALGLGEPIDLPRQVAARP